MREKSLTKVCNDVIAQLDPDRTVTFTYTERASEHLDALLSKGLAGRQAVSALRFRRQARSDGEQPAERRVGDSPSGAWAKYRKPAGSSAIGPRAALLM